MNLPSNPDEPGLIPPAESLLLKATYKKSGLTVADLAAATGLSVATLHIALNGIRYREDGPRVSAPSDITLVKLGSVLGLEPEALRAIGRDRAADLLVEANTAGPRAAVPSEQEAMAAAAARTALTIQVLGAFSTDELRTEIRRREGAEK
mgnify:CR=1 FL=1